MICVSLCEIGYEKFKDIIKDLEMAELRLDRLKFSIEEINEIFKTHKNLIATCRVSNLSERKRFDLLSQAVSAGAAYVDIELESNDLFKADLIKLARGKNSKIIVSYHNFEKTPDRRELDEIVSWCFDSGADIAKIACMVNDHKDSARLLSLYNTSKDIISIGMGDLGKITRIVATILGAPFTYASYEEGKETAAGQIDNKRLTEILETLKSVL